ncbi:5891_t:CDS:2 [Paraglomus occultum]|uniref:5891_t:CDS:1 n=1 Tax=Paraglomus occultum TaxID=144539 RepID=A0A9N9B3P4_9GLOM|nr:5891_t:CDS:2 [Paraglomus occultum]
MSEGHPSNDDTEDFKEQDRFLPIANVARIMKRALPENAKIAKEAKECVQECRKLLFISRNTCYYVLDHGLVVTASDRCQQEKRKTINGEDILWAMQSLGFENYADVLKIYLAKYRETVKLERSSAGTKEKDEDGHGVSPSFQPTQAQQPPSQQPPQQQPGPYYPGMQSVTGIQDIERL